MDEEEGTSTMAANPREATCRVEDLKIDVMNSVKSVEPIVARQWKAWDKREGCV